MVATLSPSRVETWTTCPRKFWYSNVARVPGQTWAHFTVGNAVHRALRDWFELPRMSRTRAEAQALVRRHWRSSGFRDSAQAEHWQGLSGAMVWHYVEGLDPAWEPVSRERFLGTIMAGVPVNGQIDRLDDDPEEPGALVVVDYKTGSSVPSTQTVRSSLALAIYARIVQDRLRRSCLRVELHHVPSGTVSSWQHSAESLERQCRRVRELITEIASALSAWATSAKDQDALDALFPAQPSPLCGYCDGWSQCAAGQARCAQRQPWDALADSRGDGAELEGLP